MFTETIIKTDASTCNATLIDQLVYCDDSLEILKDDISNCCGIDTCYRNLFVMGVSSVIYLSCLLLIILVKLYDRYKL